MGGMKTKSVHEVLGPSLGLLLVLGLWSAAPNALVSAQNLITFTLSDGDNVTCYPIESQKSPSNGTPFNRYPTTMITAGSNTYHTRGARRALQTMAEEVGACPDGTIPIRAPRGEVDVGSWPRVRGVAKKSPWLPVRSSPKSADTFTPPHEYGMASITDEGSQSFKGTEVFVNIWDPYVESSKEFSLAQLWFATGANTIEAGYQVSFGHYGDSLPRLFVYWTADNYNSTGCYDLDCPGFVQVSNLVLLGGSFSTSTISRHGQKRRQFEIKLRVFKDDGTGDWWLQFNDEYVGYWPKEIYTVTTPFNYGDNIGWGGEIVDDENNDGNHHTSTEMGSGKFANEGYTKAAYLRNAQYIDMNNTLVDAPIFVYTSVSSCYSAAMGTNYTDWRSFFFHGGKGRSHECGRDPSYTGSPQPSPPDEAPPPTSGA